MFFADMLAMTVVYAVYCAGWLAHLFAGVQAVAELEEDVDPASASSVSFIRSEVAGKLLAGLLDSYVLVVEPTSAHGSGCMGKLYLPPSSTLTLAEVQQQIIHVPLSSTLALLYNEEAQHFKMTALPRGATFIVQPQYSQFDECCAVSFLSLLMPYPTGAGRLRSRLQGMSVGIAGADVLALCLCMNL
jgi:hypothetical protein